MTRKKTTKIGNRRVPVRDKPPSLKSSRRRGTWAYVTLAEIEEFRLKNHLTKKKLADLIGVTNSTIHNWYQDKAIPTPNRQRQMRSMVDGPPPRSIPTPWSPRPIRTHTTAEHTATVHTAGQIVQSYLRISNKLQPDQVKELVRGVMAGLMP